MEIHEVKILFFWHQVGWIFQLGKDPIFFFFLGLCPERVGALWKILSESELFHYFYGLIKTVIHNRATECGRQGYCSGELRA